MPETIETETMAQQIVKKAEHFANREKPGEGKTNSTLCNFAIVVGASMAINLSTTYLGVLIFSLADKNAHDHAKNSAWASIEGAFLLSSCAILAYNKCGKNSGLNIQKSPSKSAFFILISAITSTAIGCWSATAPETETVLANAFITTIFLVADQQYIERKSKVASREALQEASQEATPPQIPYGGDTSDYGTNSATL